MFAVAVSEVKGGDGRENGVCVMVQLPKGIKIKLDGLRRHGTSISGFIRSVVERELTHAPQSRKDGE